MAVIPTTKLAKYATKGSCWAINKLKNHDVKIPEISCFTAGNVIHTINGLKPIEDIEVGDMVASKSDQTGEMECKPVVQVFNFDDKTVLNLTFETENGDSVQTNGKQIATLKAVATDAKTHKVYNFEVADFHTYFVGEFGIWVHNTDCGTGQHKGVGGHHIHAKAGFKDHVNYNKRKGFSISQEFMDKSNLDHSRMTAYQRRVFKELFESGRANTMREHTKIAVEAL